jgi:regulator of sirC expression with transglutaminase-like and TPR domain
MDVKTCLSTLDQWAAEVRRQTAQNLYRYRQDPAKFSNHEGIFRMKIMNAVLMQDLHVGYDLGIDSRPENFLPAKVFFANSKSLFLHGSLTGKRLGTCASLPVLYVALGRRLGYPLKLVAAKSHLFARWEGLDGRFNVECTAPGLPIHEDGYYKNWPRPMTEEDMRSGDYLKSMSAAEEFASVLTTRGACLQVNGRLEEAHAAYQRAHELV